MTLADFPELAQASEAERLALANELLATLGLDPVDPVPSQEDELLLEVKQTLDSRWKAYKEDPSRVLTLEELEARIKARFGLR